ncbi:MAG: ion transporter, partial [Oscillospiraceae bacterium]|nr:ion transporter [Oscillospiraceae bacterium]
MKRSVKILGAALVAYGLLLALLLAAESIAPDATIRSVGDAIWYSLVTMTTVGYGDLAPVTPLGRVLGMIFALTSIGILAALVGLVLRLLSGQMIPRLRLRMGRGRHWYAFAEENADAATLADELREADGGCLLVFPESGRTYLRGADVVRLNADGETLSRLRGGQEGLALFFLGADPWENVRAACRAAEEGLTAYCMADVP